MTVQQDLDARQQSRQRQHLAGKHCRQVSEAGESPVCVRQQDGQCGCSRSRGGSEGVVREEREPDQAGFFWLVPRVD